MCSSSADGTNQYGLWPLNLAVKNNHVDIVE
jgi:hypothetical protein